MKKLLLLLIVVLAFGSCEDKTKNMVWDTDATVLIRPAKGVKTRANTEHLTGLEIVEQTSTMFYYTNYSDNKYREKASLFARGFSDNQRDYQLPALKMWGTDIILWDGVMRKDFIKGFDFVLVRGMHEDETDTIAYIPNEVIRTAELGITKAYESGDYEAVYQLFDNAFTFIPITGAEYRTLQEEGLN